MRRGVIFIKKTENKLLILGIFFFIIMTISGIYALTEQGVNGALSTSAVDVEIETYILNSENKEVEYGDDKVVAPR